MSEPRHPICLGESPGIRLVLAELRKVAPSDVRVVLMGEPGTGKSTLARLLHEHSGRPGAFIAGDLPSLSDELLLSQLCGHRQGAFSGATSDQDGWLEFARGGTLFLDEIQLASRRSQEVLLGVLGRRSYRRLGEARERPTDTRFVFATNANLAKAAESGSIRHDLLARVGCVEIVVPPLRDRGEDVLQMAQFFLSEHASRRRGGRPWRVSHALAQVLLAARWPGNVWDLSMTCEYLALAPDDLLLPRHLPSTFAARQLTPGITRRARAITLADVTDALGRHGTKAAAAAALGITRQHLHRLERRTRITA